MEVLGNTANAYSDIVSGSRVLYNNDIYDVGECDGKYCNLYQNGQFKIGVVPCAKGPSVDMLLESALVLSAAKITEL